jgi:hypothetical protein
MAGFYVKTLTLNALFTKCMSTTTKLLMKIPYIVVFLSENADFSMGFNRIDL